MANIGVFADVTNVEILAHFWGGAPAAQPAAFYLALFNTAPDPQGGGTEVTGTGYVRQLVTFTQPPTNNEVKTNGVIQFPQALSSWGIVEWFAFYDAVAGGVMRGYGGFDASNVINFGDTFTVPDQGITVRQT